MKYNKKLIAVILALGVIASVGYFGPSYVLASDDNPVHSILISRIAQKFNLKESDVEAVFDAVHDERMETMRINREEKLNQAVKDGVITETQKNALFLKMKEHMEKRTQNREEMQKWFSENGIDQEKLAKYLKVGIHGGPRFK